MSPNDNMGRQRRAERYAGEFLTEPSMSAPAPIPGKPARKAAEPRNGASVPAAIPVEAAPVPEAPQQPEPVQAAAMPAWSQAYASQQPYPQQWSQSYPAQSGAAEYPQQWPQGYPMQQGSGARQWSQPYPVQQAQEYAPQQWSQPYPVQQVQEYPPQQWSQSMPVQQAGPQPWQGANGYVPPLTTPEPSEGGGDGNGGSRAFNWKLIALIAALFVIVAGATYGLTTMSRRNDLKEQVSVYNNLYCEGVYVDNIHLGGMTQEQAAAAVNASAQERLSAWGVNLTYGGQLIRRITAEDLGMTVDVNDALAEAWEQGHQSSDVDERKTAMDMLLLEPYHGYTAIPSGDTSVVDRILHELAAPVYRLPQDATVTFIPDAHSYPFEYTPEVYGSYLNVEPIKAEIYAMVDNMESGSIELVPEVIAPGVTEADLRQQRTLRGTATTEISTTSTDERTGNIQRAFQIINGTVLKPGDTFSFNGIVGARTAKNGFLPAIEYAYGNERLGYGGGVCQASTTVYLAAVRADVTVTHREPHSDKVNYTEYGLDATVNYDGKKIDLTFKNTTGSDVYIMSYLERGKNRWLCRVDIYGVALPEGVTYELVAETVEVLPAPVDPEYVEDEDGTHVVYIDDKPVQKRKASDGYVVDTFKVKYLNGVEVERTYVDTDTYKAKAQQLWVGVQERDGW